MAKVDELIVAPTIGLRLTHSKKKYAKWAKKFNVEVSSDEQNAATFGVKDSGRMRFFVYMNNNLERNDADDAAFLAHEAVHIAQNYFRFLNESNYGSEAEAYLVESVSFWLIDKHLDWKERELSKHLFHTDSYLLSKGILKKEGDGS